MNIKPKTITRGFITAGIMNMSVLIFSRLFNNPVISQSDPDVMSNFGLLMIVIWGLAYISVAKTYHHAKWLILVFAIEKLIYGVIWTMWMFNNSVADVFDKDIMAGAFFSVYGINDWLFFVFFVFVFFQLHFDNKETPE
ncbi:hypothetical protein [Psychroserpens sp. Hel_I_66]|uniref:hypothetical protein n=1 Tax=Psychroserpens sp. Hel_I_66 TaxID=1250004 RepID=UPI000645A27A|nr:hypothetical protein [Psychroserpens sp. Hel_I_66]